MSRLNLLPFLKSLSARLLMLTILFVMLSEVLIFVPSVARFRLDWLEQKLTDANLALLALEATPDNMVSQELADRLLANAGAYAIRLVNPRKAASPVVQRALVMKMPPKVDATTVLAETTMSEAIIDALTTLARSGSRTLRIVGAPRQEPSMPIHVVLDEVPLRRDMQDYGRRILNLSLVISLVTAALVYFSLQWLLVGPMRRVTAAMIVFREDPEDPGRILAPSKRLDEIGIAERELVQLQESVYHALRQRARLAALGTAVAKINHDLRNILSTARLISDRLADDPSPEVRRVIPSLLAAIDRAIDLCTGTLDFTREGDPPLRLSQFALAELIDDLAAITPPDDGSGTMMQIENRVPASLLIRADRDQLHRILLNLARNAAEAGAKHLLVEAVRVGGLMTIDIADDGPGLNPRARDNLFIPFAGSGRPGGTGLGLAIARELMRAHGGEVTLVETGAAGSRFQLTIPQREAARDRQLEAALNPPQESAP
jgi:signal transduction histidine kinase